MASTSGTKHPVGMSQKSLSRRFSRIPSTITDSEIIPQSLAADIAPILHVADEIEPTNPRVAYLCRSHALEKANNLDPLSSGRYVRQFKTYLSHKLEKEGAETKRMLAENGSREMQKFYQRFYEENVKEGHTERKPEEMAKNYQMASILYDVLKTVAPSMKFDKLERYAEEVERKKKHYAQFNILPLHTSGATSPIMELPEIKAAVNALRRLDNLPKPKIQSTESAASRNEHGDESIHDLLDWLWLTFGFQKGNVANQREHLILLLANLDTRNRNHEEYSRVNSDTVKLMKDKIFENYRSWCDYLRIPSNLDHPSNHDMQQLDLLYIGLYLLIWGEASNIRFMPECICYIFHHMANELNGILYGNVHPVIGDYIQPTHHGEESFLQEVITPIYQVMLQEAKENKGGTGRHSKWRNYDDLNEYFWTKKECLRWPINYGVEHGGQGICGRRKPKTNFVEVRTFWHLFRSFDRMWIFFILVFQAMVIVAWSPSGSVISFFDPDVFKNVLSIFITAAFLNFLKATLDIILSWKARGSMKRTQIIRYLLKFAVAAVWVIVLPIGYSSSVQNPTGLVKFFSNWAGNWQNQSFYSFAVVIYVIPNVLAALLFMLPSLRRSMERSNRRIVILLMWWDQPKLYVGRGMHVNLVSLLKYTLFWILLLISKLAFSYYVEILPLIEPTKLIMGMRITSYEWHEFFPNVQHNIGVVISIWAPIVMVYFMDAQLWYAIFSTIFGGINGTFSHLGEIRTLQMLKSRFEVVPNAFSERLLPSSKERSRGNHTEDERKNINAKFSKVWNRFISSLREEDLISNKEKDVMLLTESSNAHVQWPPFMLASKIPEALNMVEDHQEKAAKEDSSRKREEEEDLYGKIKNDKYMHSAVMQGYETLRDIFLDLFDDGEAKSVVHRICGMVENSILQRRFLSEFRLSELPQLINKLEKLLKLLEIDHVEDLEIICILERMMNIITHDVIIKDDGDHMETSQKRDQNQDNKINPTVDLKKVKKKVVRLHFLLTENENAINIPRNLDARRRITFFANSLFMNMPDAPKVRNMLSFSVLTPYYNEEVLYTKDKVLDKKNEDGISILFYLRKIYQDEWDNFLERIYAPPKENTANYMDEVQKWVSYRAQTLSRTVRGMMYYKEAIKLQCTSDIISKDQDGHCMEKEVVDQCLLADMKFTYVVSCQLFGKQKFSSNVEEQSRYKNILDLMLAYPSLRVAYIDEREETVNGKAKKVYYSVLLKGGAKTEEEIYRIRLPGSPIAIGEGKPENQNHAIIFTRGEALQTIDMNQDNYLEEAVKMRNILEEFLKSHDGHQKPTILGLREHIFTESVSSLAWFMSKQETSFVTIGQRVLANPLKVRFHYGHPDIFDRIFHITRGGISKASKLINLSEDIFSGFNSTLRGGNVTHHEYMQVGKGRDVGMNQISSFEAKVSNGNGEQTLSRDVYRLGRRFDFYRMLSFYFTTVGFYVSSMVTVLTVYVFLYGRLYLVLSGLEKAILDNSSNIQQSKSLETVLASQSAYQLGLLLVLPMLMETGLEKGFDTALVEFIIMQLQLASFFFTFQLGTKAHYYGRTILHGGAKYIGTGRGFVVFHAKFAENYRLYSRSHFVKGFELMILLVVYEVYGHSYRSSSVYLFVTFSIWLLIASWLFAPFIFNPSGFEWQKTVDDWTDWKKWMGGGSGIGMQPEISWESWWNGKQQEHLKHTDIRGRVLEIILALRFLIYQYGIVYRLNIAQSSKSVLVYGLSWLVMATVLLVLKMVSMGRHRFGIDIQPMFRILKGLIFLGFLSIIAVVYVVAGLTITDIFATIVAFIPTGWACLLIGQACRCWLSTVVWDPLKELARAYEYVMGIIIFMPVAVISWFPFFSDFQTRMLFNQAFSRGLQISRILAGEERDDHPVEAMLAKLNKKIIKV